MADDYSKEQEESDEKQLGGESPSPFGVSGAADRLMQKRLIPKALKDVDKQGKLDALRYLGDQRYQKRLTKAAPKRSK